MTNTLAEVIEKQLAISEKIDANVTNYGKDSESRKTVEYLERRISAHKDIMKQIELNHSIIIAFDQSKDTDYINENIIDSIKRKALKHMETLQDKLKSKQDEQGLASNMFQYLGDDASKKDDPSKKWEKRIIHLENNYESLHLKYENEKENNAC